MVTEKSFIKLHTADANKPFIVQDIMFVNAVREEDSTKVVYQSDTDMTEEIDVNEMPERISQLLDVPTILVHNSEDNRPVCINISHIRAICPEDGETNIVLFDDSICVNEAPEKALKLLNENISRIARKKEAKTTDSQKVNSSAKK